MLHLLSLCFLLLASVLADGQSSCPHHYTSQPPEDIVCNPYVLRTIQLQCAVTGSELRRIQWYFSATNSMNIFDEDVLEITNTSKYSLYESSGNGELSVILAVNDLDEDTDTGTYWCRAFLKDGRMLIPTNSFELKTSDTYSLNIACRQNLIIKSSMSTCARVFVFTPTATTIIVSSPLPTNGLLFPTPEDMTGHVIRSEGPTTVDLSVLTTMPSGSSEIPLLYIIIALIGFLTAICMMLALVICLLCKRVRNKSSHRVIEFGHIPNQVEFCTKRPDFAILPIESSLESNKNSTGDYAEIGPELMSSVRFHSCGGNTSHYSEINDVMLQPMPCETNRNVEETVAPLQESDSKGNPYDEPNSAMKPIQSDPSVAVTTIPPENTLLCHNYSRLERMVPFIYVSNESDTTDSENLVENSAFTLNHHYYHTLEQSMNGNTYLYTDTYSASDQTDGDLYSGKILLSNHHLPTILEHPYHVLEQSGPLFDADYQDTDILHTCNQYVVSQSVMGDKNENYDYDRLVDPQLYSLLDHSTTTSGLSKIYDVQSGPYSKLDAQVTSQYRRRSKSIAELELSAEIFDDVQYIASPVPTPNSVDEIDLNTSIEDRVESRSSSGEKRYSKYNGDYERDPIYMERMKSDDSTKSASLPNIYQPLQVTAMDPIQDYENYLPRPCSYGTEQ